MAAKRSGFDLQNHHCLVEVSERRVGLHQIYCQIPLPVHFGHMYVQRAVRLLTSISAASSSPSDEPTISVTFAMACKLRYF